MKIDFNMTNNERYRYIMNNYDMRHVVAESLIKGMDCKLSNFNMKEPTIKLPVHYVDEHLSLLPDNLFPLNAIEEEGKYFIVNGVKVRKSRFFKQWLGCEIPTNTDGTHGELYFTVDPATMLGASDEEFVSWRSCYRPDGEHFDSCIHCAASPNVGMVMIVDSEQEKILGRRYAILVRDGENTALYLLPVYGNMPKKFRVSAQRWFIENIFNGESVTITKPGDNVGKKEECVSIPYVTGRGEFYNNMDNDDATEWWVDGSRWIISKNVDEYPDFVVDLPEWWNLRETGQHQCCHCEKWFYGNLSSIINESPVCPSCFRSLYVYSSYHDAWVIRSQCVEIMLKNRTTTWVLQDSISAETARIHYVSTTDVNDIRAIVMSRFHVGIAVPKHGYRIGYLHVNKNDMWDKKLEVHDSYMLSFIDGIDILNIIIIDRSIQDTRPILMMFQNIITDELAKEAARVQ